MHPGWLLAAAGCFLAAAGSPLTSDVSQVPRSKKVFDFPLLIKKTQKNDVGLIGKLIPK